MSPSFSSQTLCPVFISPVGGWPIYVDPVFGLGCFPRRVEVIILEAGPTSLRCCQCLIRSCQLRMGQFIILLEYLEGEGPGSVPSRNTGSRMLPAALVRTVIGTGQDLVIGILRRPSPVPTTPTTRIILTNTVREGAPETSPLRVLDRTIPPHITLQDRNLTS